MEISENQWKEILVDSGFVDENDFINILSTVKADINNTVEQIVVTKGLMTNSELGQLIADFFSYKYVKLDEKSIPKQALEIIPELVAKVRHVIIFDLTETEVKLAMYNPEDKEIIRMVENKTSLKADVYYTTLEAIKNACNAYTGKIGDKIEKMVENPDAIIQDEDAIVDIVDAIIEYGYVNKASDIHIEPLDYELVVRLRIDGVLHDVITIDKRLLDLITTRIKIMSRLRTDEHMSAQDGKLQFKTGDAEIDVRVSILPSTGGEKTVMRLLSDVARSFSLENLGMADHHFEIMNKAISNSHGMILVTGPTGSGKTTTLYAVLKMLNKREVNISTIEDPVEYDIEGVTQVQTNKKTNLTFAKGLRSLMRQDPDIIMVGEIRDEETADIAINAALTGHLVLSTLHTNDAATTIPRLLDMNIEPFLVASTVQVIVAQRLVRRLCTSCMRSKSISESTLNLIKLRPDIIEILKKSGYDLDKLTVYQGEGCDHCVNSGYRGRVGVFEILEMDDKIRELVVQRINADKITETAKSNGMSTMLEDGVNKVLTGLTTFEEVLRVSQ